LLSKKIDSLKKIYIEAIIDLNQILIVLLNVCILKIFPSDSNVKPW
jgi:hypothetical protein